MLLAALFSSGNGLISTYLAIVADERGIANIAVFFTVYSICMVALRPLVGKLLDKKGVYMILIPSVIFAALGMIFVGIGYSLAMMIMASVFKAFGQGSGTPSLQAHAVKTLDKSRAGVATSTIMIGQNVGNAVAPIVGSFFVTAYGYEKMFCGFGVILLLAGMLILFLNHRKEKSKA
jgi:MFS family permease